jgi:anti-anti-sigma regulatory factor
MPDIPLTEPGARVVARAVPFSRRPLDLRDGRPAGAHVIALEGRVDPAAIDALDRRIAGAVADGHERIVVDLSAISLLVLPALGPFCDALRHATRDGATVTVVGGHPHIRRTLELRAIHGVRLHEPPRSPG